MTLGCLWWNVRVYYPSRVRWYLKEALPWKLALWLPRKVALMAFVRVYAVTGECGPEYERVLNEWERQA